MPKKTAAPDCNRKRSLFPREKRINLVSRVKEIVRFHTPQVVDRSADRIAYRSTERTTTEETGPLSSATIRPDTRSVRQPQCGRPYSSSESKGEFRELLRCPSYQTGKTLTDQGADETGSRRVFVLRRPQVRGKLNASGVTAMAATGNLKSIAVRFGDNGSDLNGCHGLDFQVFLHPMLDKARGRFRCLLYPRSVRTEFSSVARLPGGRPAHQIPRD